ncbi:TetR/AcrR family transcriptional regulator [Actinoplanes couchii]|uniref:TetR family transcriptional regulator n=1 Tax=Actinoplanes couchii TaxID=403638 RepID=A0ABQ3X8V2_9ACTN|nr:TetR/AcrR family transcriptional regulator [Actinoplanes couchii]MDR6320131.1 AcrR family transcriptional regulator [Actinoplanes couchii]GID54855.1 TetR family transcriptional regulator [Actinoplanes couchii]
MKRAEQVIATREALLTAAERLFAERGVHAVGNRDIAQAAGQGNIAAVSYHFGTKADLVRVIIRRHTEPIGRIRQRLMTEAQGSDDLRAWVACLVRPLTEHLDALGNPTWYARFTAQVRADPTLAAILTEESVEATPDLASLQVNLARCLPELPDGVLAARTEMTRHLVATTVIDRERALADGNATLGVSWEQITELLLDAVVGLLRAPVTMLD